MWGLTGHLDNVAQASPGGDYTWLMISALAGTVATLATASFRYLLGELRRHDTVAEKREAGIKAWYEAELTRERAESERERAENQALRERLEAHIDSSARLTQTVTSLTERLVRLEDRAGKAG